MRGDGVPGTGAVVQSATGEFDCRLPQATVREEVGVTRATHYLLLPLPETVTRLAGELGTSDRSSVGRSLGESVAESERASSLFFSTSVDGGSSEELEDRLWPMRPLRREELPSP